MNYYALTALVAQEYAAKGLHPTLAWESAALKVFGERSAKNKGCPKSAFLGLCENGLIKGIPSGKYTRSVKNKSYALAAVKILAKGQSDNISPSELWRRVVGTDIVHNAQMDVVLELCKKELIIK